MIGDRKLPRKLKDGNEDVAVDTGAQQSGEPNEEIRRRCGGGGGGQMCREDAEGKVEVDGTRAKERSQ